MKQAQQVRRLLREVGEARNRHRVAGEELQQATREALKDAEGVVPTTEAARLLGLNRSTIYEFYRGDKAPRRRPRRA